METPKYCVACMMTAVFPAGLHGNCNAWVHFPGMLLHPSCPLECTTFTHFSASIQEKSGQLWMALVFYKPPCSVCLGSQGCEAQCWAQVQIQPGRTLASPIRLSPSFFQPVWVITTFPSAGEALRMPVIFCLQIIATGLWVEHSWWMSEQLSFGCVDAPRK